MYKEAIFVKFKHLPRHIEDNHDKPQSRYPIWRSREDEIRTSLVTSEYSQ
jgi:hypothetical protein